MDRQLSFSTMYGRTDLSDPSTPELSLSTFGFETESSSDTGALGISFLKSSGPKTSGWELSIAAKVSKTWRVANNFALGKDLSLKTSAMYAYGFGRLKTDSSAFKCPGILDECTVNQSASLYSLRKYGLEAVLRLPPFEIGGQVLMMAVDAPDETLIPAAGMQALLKLSIDL